MVCTALHASWILMNKRPYDELAFSQYLAFGGILKTFCRRIYITPVVTGEKIGTLSQTISDEFQFDRSSVQMNELINGDPVV